MAGWTGLEPATSGVTGRRSNQLNYHPINENDTCCCRDLPDLSGRSNQLNYHPINESAARFRACSPAHTEPGRGNPCRLCRSPQAASRFLWWAEQGSNL